MKHDKQTLSAFAEDLASASPAPGGGGAAALVGALGASLASMVANLTAGKKKYAQYEGDIQRILREAEELRKALLSCIEADASGFAPLARAYGMPKDDPKRDEVMEDALRVACSAPMKMIALTAKVVDLHAELLAKGSAIMVSDVGVGVLCAKAALLGAGLNIRVNAGMMKDREYAEAQLSELQKTVDEYSVTADEIYSQVLQKLS